MNGSYGNKIATSYRLQQGKLQIIKISRTFIIQESGLVGGTFYAIGWQRLLHQTTNGEGTKLKGGKGKIPIPNPKLGILFFCLGLITHKSNIVKPLFSLFIQIRPFSLPSIFIFLNLLLAFPPLNQTTKPELLPRFHHYYYYYCNSLLVSPNNHLLHFYIHFQAPNMDGGATQYNPRTVEEVFRDFKGRRAGMIKALTSEVEEFYQQCDPEKENLCLYGFPSEQWEVNLPAEEVPPELPEPALGINFARDGMQEKDWLSLVAVHSDAWLLSVAFYFGARFGFDKADRKRLFNMINDLPTIFEVVSGIAKKAQKEKTAVSNHSSTKSKSNSKVREPESQGKYPKQQPPPPPQPSLKDDDDGLDDEEDDEHGETLCGACGENYASDEFWICCDICEKWFHGKCVKITPARAEHIKQYKCPSCSNKRARP
ncbi:hypothetical protein L6452_07830 [Arctium lappa]|uniref:Uncharacterized protein n=1 Tax=Arctium lappa TaxID=4217 RepID=A0ACB9EMD1_ARCLA|nr:hypothetical protein L6452_07830 [Arctium lappa]